MRETNNNFTDSRNVTTDTAQTERGHTDKKRRIDNDPNNYMFEDYEIHETFDPNGPPFADCIVRVFA
ncbi:hypothetical protein FACS1894219_11750 [Clostridia bacterium]|nr:hypothetical protein FACS1894219_11750 [Clostridia bacterium]